MKVVILASGMQSTLNNEIVRNPYSIRPYQHVLEPVMAYLMIAQKQYEDVRYAGSYNMAV